MTIQLLDPARRLDVGRIDRHLCLVELKLEQRRLEVWLLPVTGLELRLSW